MRLDGRLLKRFDWRQRRAAGRFELRGRRRTGLRRHPVEAFMQATGDAVCSSAHAIEAGTRTVGVSFVRQLFEPEGCQALQRGRVLTNDQIYMENARRSVQIGGPFTVTGATRHRQPLGNLRVRLASASMSSARPDPVTRRQARTAAGRLGRRPTLLAFSTKAGKPTALDAGIQFALERMLVDPDFAA